MSDNRFKDYPTKRIPSLKQENSDEISQSHIDYDEEDYDYEDYDDEAIEPEYDTKPIRRRREPEDHVPRGSRRAEYGQPQKRPRKNPSAYYGDKPQHSRSRTAFIGIYIGLLVIAVAACITVFVLVFQWMAREGPNPGELFEREPSVTDETNEPVAPAGRPDIRRIETMITGIASDPRGLVLLDLETLEANIEMPLSEEAAILDRSNNAITFSELRIGQLVQVEYDARMPEITSVREHPHARVFSERRNAIIDLENLTISVGHDATFLFNSQTLIWDRGLGERIPIDRISPADSVTVIGLRDTAWMIQLDAASGSLQLSNTNEIINGRITVGSLHPLFLSEITGPIDVVEGPHHITVTGDNIEDFETTIVIVPRQTITLDLGAIELSTATLNITTTPADANIFINDEPVTSPAEVSFGEHTVRVEHDGYVTEERVVDVTRPTETIRFELEAVIQDAILILFTSPANTEIFVNNEPVGRANPNIILDLPPGSYSIMARLDSHVDYTFNIQLSPGQEVTRSMTLTPIAILIPNVPDTPGDNNDDTGPGFFIPPPPPPPAPPDNDPSTP